MTEPEDLTPLQRAWRTVVLLVILAACIWATWEHFTRKAEAEEASGYPEVVQEVVSPKPEVVWMGDSIKAVRTDLDPSGWIQGTVKEAR